MIPRILFFLARKEVKPHRLEENRETSRRAAAGENNPGKVERRGGGGHRNCQCLDHRVDQLGKLRRSEDVAHRDRHLAVAALQALDARERRALEILLQRRRDRIGLFRRQEAELELLLVVDEIAGFRLRRL